MKVAALQRAWQLNPTELPWIWIDTGQHYDASLATQYFSEYSIEWDLSLACGELGQTPTHTLGNMLISLETTLTRLRTARVVVFGDANTSLAGALAAKRCGMELCHVEAGVRTGAATHEEINRVVIDRLSDLHLASSERDLANLGSEGYGESSAFLGDLVQDLCADMLSAKVDQEDFVLVTLHRAENFHNLRQLEQVRDALASLGMPCIFVAHPRVLRTMTAEHFSAAKWVVNESLPHRELLGLLRRARLVVTDSGALQREAYYLERRAIVVQDRPFWMNLIEAGVHMRAQTSAEIVAAATAILSSDVPVRPGLFGEPPIGARAVELIRAWGADAVR